MQKVEQILNSIMNEYIQNRQRPDSRQSFLRVCWPNSCQVATHLRPLCETCWDNVGPLLICWLGDKKTGQRMDKLTLLGMSICIPTSHLETIFKEQIYGIDFSGNDNEDQTRSTKNKSKRWKLKELENIYSGSDTQYKWKILKFILHERFGMHKSDL